MLPTWDAMASGIAMQPVPPELCRVTNITCNDCEKRHSNRAWHFLGVQCSHCQSFNTVVDKMVYVGQEAHDFLQTHGDGKELEEPLTTEEEMGSSPHPRRVNRRRSAI
jgi:hypothetical protein